MRGHGILLVALLGLAGCTPEKAPTEGIRVIDALGTSEAAAGFARATGPRVFRFPQDHGPHPDYRNEWWYLTGNLDDEEGRRYGFQATFFRIALDPEPAERPSQWAASQVWMAHAAVTDIEGERHLAAERFARGALGLAGARARPLRVWLEDWSLESERGGGFPWRLELDAGAFELSLEVEPTRGPVLQGDAGLSRKSSEPGNASYYYSLTRLEASGSLSLDSGTRRVQGLAWLDREWSTSALGERQAGWDWLSLQLDDGRDLMYYRMRRMDGSADPHSEGTLVSADGGKRRLGAGAVSMEPLAYWTGPRGARYPVAWRLEAEGLEGPLHVRALLEDQLMELSVRYWEGAVEALDPATGRRLGRGYLEMTGYEAEGG